MKEKIKFFDLKVHVFINKNNGQLSLTLPKKKLKNIPKELPIRIPIKFFKKEMKGGNL